MLSSHHISIYQGTLQRAAWRVANSNRVALNDVLAVIANLRQLQATGLAAEYDNAYMVCDEICVTVVATTSCTEPWLVPADELQLERLGGARPPQSGGPIDWRIGPCHGHAAPSCGAGAARQACVGRQPTGWMIEQTSCEFMIALHISSHSSLDCTSVDLHGTLRPRNQQHGFKFASQSLASLLLAHS